MNFFRLFAEHIHAVLPMTSIHYCQWYQYTINIDGIFYRNTPEDLTSSKINTQMATQSRQSTDEHWCSPKHSSEANSYLWQDFSQTQTRNASNFLTFSGFPDKRSAIPLYLILPSVCIHFLCDICMPSCNFGKIFGVLRSRTMHVRNVQYMCEADERNYDNVYCNYTQIRPIRD